jgi:hypothetical protein
VDRACPPPPGSTRFCGDAGNNKRRSGELIIGRWAPGVSPACQTVPAGGHPRSTSVVPPFHLRCTSVTGAEMQRRWNGHGTEVLRRCHREGQAKLVLSSGQAASRRGRKAGGGPASGRERRAKGVSRVGTRDWLGHGQVKRSGPRGGDKGAAQFWDIRPVVNLLAGVDEPGCSDGHQEWARVGSAVDKPGSRVRGRLQARLSDWDGVISYRSKLTGVV